METAKETGRTLRVSNVARGLAASALRWLAPPVFLALLSAPVPAADLERFIADVPAEVIFPGADAYGVPSGSPGRHPKAYSSSNVSPSPSRSNNGSAGTP